MTSPAAKPLALCLGNSIVAGTMGHNWVAALAVAHPSLAFQNEGVNGAQIPGVMADVACLLPTLKPAAIVLHIGGSDVAFSFGVVGLLSRED